MSRNLSYAPRMSHPLLQHSCHYVQNQNYIPRYHLAQEQVRLGHEGLVL